MRRRGLLLLSFVTGVTMHVLPALSLAQSPAPCAPCAVVTLGSDQHAALPPSLQGLELLVSVDAGREDEATAMLSAIRSRDGRPGLLIEGIPARALPDRVLSGIDTVVVRLGEPDENVQALSFALKTALSGIRGAATHPLRLGVSADDPLLESLLLNDLGAYIDFIIGSPVTAHRWVSERWVERGALTGVRAALLGGLEAGQARSLWRGSEDTESLRRLLHDLSRAVPILPEGLIPEPGFHGACGEARTRGWLDPVLLARVALLPRCDSADAAVSPPDPGAERVVLSSGDVLVRVLPAGQDHFSERIQVHAARQLSVAEIIARHQAAAARQAARVHTLISTGTLTLTFEAPGFPAPIGVTARSVTYADAVRTEIEQRDIRVNGVEFRGAGVPRLPILEPERVSAAPLAVALTDLYRYRLEGRETIAETPCYIVGFVPVAHDRSLFTGRAWIAADSFAMVRVAAAQTALRGSVISSEQVDEFRPEGEDVWLLARSDVRQVYEGAGYRTPIHRVLVIDTHEVNPTDFEQRRQVAYASESVMLRDTPQGYRYLRRQLADSGHVASEQPALAGRSTRIRTFAFGALIDPNITRPLPFAGLSYLDLDLFGTGAQFNGFFGGMYGQLVVSDPSFLGTRWQLGGRASGIAADYNDRAFSEGLEQYAQNILQRPAHASVWVLRPLTPRVSLRAEYDLDYTRFAAGEGTDPLFSVPANQVVHGLRLALEGQRGGWNGTIWWNPARRAGWRPWGYADGNDYYATRHHNFQRYGISIARSAVLTPGVIARGEAVWMSGRDLDRFSRYAFGGFENRLRGYPAALIRYDRGTVLRGVLAWSAARRLRLDGFVDSAYVRDPGFGPQPKRFTGLGAAVEAPAPLRTLLALEWGFGMQGVDAGGTQGTHVVRISAYRIF